MRTDEEISRVMSSIRSQNTKPELIVRRLLHSLGYRYRLHKASLPGSPDLVFPSRRKVIFIHGCFWHRHNCPLGQKTPRTRTDYWLPKLKRNVERDKRDMQDLRQAGWSVCVIWECRVRDAESLVKTLVRFLTDDSRL